MPSYKEDYVFGVILTAGRSRASASGESKAQFKRVDGADRMQMLGSISYVSPAPPRLASPLPPSCVSNLLNHRKANPPFENTGPGILLLFFWPGVGLCVPALEASLHTLGIKRRKKKSSQHENLKAARPHGRQRNYPHREIPPSTAAPPLEVVTQCGRGRASS